MCVYFVFLFFTKIVQSFGLIVLFDFLKCLLNERNTGKKVIQQQQQQKVK